MRIIKPLALLLVLLLVFTLSGCMARLIYDAVQDGRHTPEATSPAMRDSRQDSVQLPATQDPSADMPVQDSSTLPGMADGFLPMTPDSPVNLDLDGDGTEDSLAVSISVNEEYGIETILLIANYGDAVKTTQVSEAYLQSAYLSVDNAGNTGVLVSFDYASDDYQTCVYLFNGRDTVLTDETSGFVESVEGGVVRVRGCVNVLGTWGAHGCGRRALVYRGGCGPYADRNQQSGCDAGGWGRHHRNPADAGRPDTALRYRREGDFVFQAR